MRSGKELQASRQGAQEVMCRNGCNCAELLCEEQACACQKRGTVKGESLLPYAPLPDPAQMHARTNEPGLGISSLPKADLKQKRLRNPLSIPENMRV